MYNVNKLTNSIPFKHKLEYVVSYRDTHRENVSQPGGRNSDLKRARKNFRKAKMGTARERLGSIALCQ